MPELRQAKSLNYYRSIEILQYEIFETPAVMYIIHLINHTSQKSNQNEL